MIVRSTFLNEAGPVRRNLCAQVVDRLGKQIVGGTFSEGQTIPNEAVLGREFGVSRSVVREAVKQLAAKGLVESRAKTGTRVRPRMFWNLLDIDVLGWRYATMPRRDFFRSLFEVRTVIEPSAAELAATKASDEEIAALGKACNEMEAADPDGDDAIAADVAFHRQILLACHNELLLQMGMLIGVGLFTSHRISTKSYPASLPMHRPIFEAIRRRDPAAARAAMQHLLTETAAFIERELCSDDHT